MATRKIVRHFCADGPDDRNHRCDHGPAQALDQTGAQWPDDAGLKHGPTDLWCSGVDRIHHAIDHARAGDVIATGTPPGVGFARKPPVFLKPGDQMEVLIEGIGGLGIRWLVKPDKKFADNRFCCVRGKL